MEQVRIVKEMREHDRQANNHRGIDIKPRYMVWENVPGALSSGNPKGEDFRIVLEEICKICDESITIPRPARWNSAGCIMGPSGEWSVAWRITDSQFYGVPQRRRRIALVADFGAGSAPEILFECESMSGDIESCDTTRKSIATDITGSSGKTSERLKAFGISPYTSNSMLSNNPNSGIYEADTSRTLDLNGGNPACNQGGIAIIERSNE